MPGNCVEPPFSTEPIWSTTGRGSAAHSERFARDIESALEMGLNLLSVEDTPTFEHNVDTLTAETAYIRFTLPRAHLDKTYMVV